jgi:hypothetical protein
MWQVCHRQQGRHEDRLVEVGRQALCAGPVSAEVVDNRPMKMGWKPTMSPLTAEQPGHAREGRALDWALIALCLVFMALWAGVWSLWGRDGFPVGAAWWDELALSGAARAVQRGMVPGIDFWAPFILPIYLKALAQTLAGLRAGYVLECLLQGLLVLLLFTSLLRGRRHRGWVYLIGACAVAQATLPFNVGSVVQAEMGSVVYAGAYNRLGGAIFTLVVLAMTMRAPVGRDRGLAVWMGVVLAITFLVKVSVFQLCAVVCIAHELLCLGGTGRWWWCKPLGLALVLLALILLPTGIAGPHLLVLQELSSLRMSLWQRRLGVSEQVLAQHQVELLALALCGALAIGRGVLGRTPWLGLVIWFLLSVGVLVFYMLSNFGDNGLSPLLACVYALSVGPRAATPGLAPGMSPALANSFGRSLRGLLALGAMLYFGVCIQWSWALVERQHAVRLIHFPVTTKVLGDYHLIDALAWQTRPPISVPGVTVDNRSTGTYAAYVEGLDEALQFLSRQRPDTTKSVYALDFPAYAFAVLGGYRIPAHSRPWLMHGHEFSQDVHPSSAQIFADVDVLMVSKCSLALGNRRNLAAMYRDDMQRVFQPLAQLTCWDVWVRP